MKLTSVTIEGLRGIDHELMSLGPVTYFTGPNGVGKTATVGAVAYALTGRFPGFAAVHPGELLGLANDRGQGFRVRLETDVGTTVDRGVTGTAVTDRPEQNLVVRHNGKRSKGGIKDAEAMLREAFGDVGWFVDAFDPERSLWRLSGEKRKEWALNLCAGSSGWTRERLLGQIGPKSDDWDATIGRDAGSCLELNLYNLHEKLLGLQRLVREANTVAEGVTIGANLGLITQRVNDAEQQYEVVRQKVTALDHLQSNTKAQQATVETARRERVRLETATREARGQLEAMLPPAPPVLSPDVAGLAAREAEHFGLELEIEAVDAELLAAFVENGSASEELKRTHTVCNLIEAGARCPTCGANQPDPEQAIVARDRANLRAQFAIARHDTAQQQAESSHAALAKLEAELASLRSAKQIYDHETATFAARKAAFDGTWQTVLRNVQSLDEQLARLPADRADLNPANIDHDLDEVRTTLGVRKAALAQARNDLGVATERAGQLKAATDAKDRIEVVQALLARVRAARDRMLDDAMQSLADALVELRALAPAGGRWTLLRGDKTVDVCLRRAHQDIPVSALSAGERMRATIALLLARSMVRREPWVGIFVDNFEQVHPAGERADVLRALAAAARMGFIDNALVAGACEPLSPNYQMAIGDLEDIVMYNRAQFAIGDDRTGT